MVVVMVHHGRGSHRMSKHGLGRHENLMDAIVKQANTRIRILVYDNLLLGKRHGRCCSGDNYGENERAFTHKVPQSLIPPDPPGAGIMQEKL